MNDQDGQLQAGVDALLSGVLRLQLAERRVEGRVARRFGLSQSDVLALAIVVRTQHQTIGAVAAELDLSPGATSTLVDRLVTAGLLARVPNPHDGRSRLVAATRLGIDTVHEVRDDYAAAIRAAADVVTPECIMRAAAVLTGTARALDAQPERQRQAV